MSTALAITETTTGRAAESGHWYDRLGNPVYEVPKVKGGMKPCTLREARMLQLARGVTSITRQKASPALTNYFVEQAYDACATATAEEEALRHKDAKMWRARMKDLATEHSRNARERGTIRHAEIEHGICGGEPPYSPWYTAFRMECVRVLGDFPKFSAEHSFASRYGYGCKLDCIAPGVIVDHKGKDLKDGETPRIYDENLMQLAAQRQAALEAGYEFPIRCFNNFFDRTSPRSVMVEATDIELARGWQMFLCCLQLSRLDDSYVPEWAVKDLWAA